MVTLYGAQGSGSAAIEVALAMAGVPHRRVEAAPWQPSAEVDELRRVNPLAQVPTLQLGDGSVLSESAAILIHLGLEHPASGLLPAAASQRAQALRGLVFIAANCYAAIGVIDYPERWSTDVGDAAHDAIRAAARQRLHAMWSLFADQFTGSPWLGGERIGALDILAATVSTWSGARAHLQSARPALFALLLRIEAHPQVAPVWARHWPLS